MSTKNKPSTMSVLFPQKRSRKKPAVVVNVACCGQMCLDDMDGYVSPEELDAISKVFSLAAAALREKRHGQIVCKNPDNEMDLAYVGIDTGGKILKDVGLPIIHKVVVAPET